MAVERAMLARFRGDPAATLALSKEAVTLARNDDDVILLGDAVVVAMQAAWQLGQLDEALALASDVAYATENLSADEHVVVVAATWLQTLCKAGAATPEDLERFAALVTTKVDSGFGDRAIAGGEAPLSPRRAAMVVGQVAAEFNRSGSLRDTLSLVELRYTLAVSAGSASMRCAVALEAMEVAAELGERALLEAYLLKAQSAVALAQTGNKPAEATWQTLRANVLFAHGRATSRLAGLNSDTESADHSELLIEAEAELEAALKFTTDESDRIAGPVDDYLTDLRWWLGRVKRELLRLDEAAALFHAVRSSPAMAHRGFVDAIGMQAWLFEADSHLWSGRPEHAFSVARALLADGRATDEMAAQARRLLGYLENVVLPSKSWLGSDDAGDIADSVRRDGLQRVVSAQVAPLVAWWREWSGSANNPDSEFLDFWGRGGFVRVAAAVRARPHSAVAVDARNIEDIRRWARVLCPLFDTVIVKWKGELGGGAMVLVPIRDDFGNIGTFGGHGYEHLSDTPREGWHVAASMSASPLPRRVSRFLATEALDLFEAGRLLVVPAPLVGSTQNAVGWTDHLLLDGLLGGVVDVVEPAASAASASGQRVLDLARYSLPYVADVSLRDLAAVLDDAEEWAAALRAHLMRSLLSDDLRHENWGAIAAMENEINDSCNHLRHGLERLSRRQGWAVTASTASVAAGSQQAHPATQDPATGLLWSLVAERPDLGPWIPYFRLQERGGHLDWTCPINNPSGPRSGGSGQSWLSPGTPGVWWRPVIVPSRQG